ncbi:hypothetical protein [Gorillibacterium sp. sgz500922]|uniref:hypothetical protein n=1 Tax=Gorillibacterium sp. sgz500922 TaxID=3446694 RepID=UPI003F6627DC
MGLDAYVACNCVKEGKAKKPPFDESLLVWKQGFPYLDESAPDGWCSLLYDPWRETACEHPDFYYFSDRVYNASGHLFYNGIMDRLGKGTFPHLDAVWRSSFTPDQAEAAMQDLERLESRLGEVEGVFLVDPATGKEYRDALTGNQNWFFSAGAEYTYILNEQGFNILGPEGEVWFRSLAFSQEIIRTMVDGKESVTAVFRDKATGQEQAGGSTFNWKTWGVDELEYPAFLEVVVRPLCLDDVYTLIVLRKLLEAVIDTGNPIVWA